MLTRWYLSRALAAFRLSESPASVATAEDLVRLSRLSRVIFASTDILYEGSPRLTQFFAMDDQTLATKERVLQVAASLAAAGKSPDHGALCAAAAESGFSLREVDADILSNGGVTARLDRLHYVLGDEAALQDEGVEIGVSVQRLADQLEREGHYLLYLAQKQPKRLLGVFACVYPLRPDTITAVQALHELGVETVLLSSAKQAQIKAVARQLGIALLHTELSEQEKQEVADALFAQKRVTALIVTPGHAVRASFEILVAPEPAKASVWAPSLSSVPGLISRARDAVKRVRRQLFWVKLKA